MAFKHGITLTEVNTGSRTLRAVSTAVIGLVATAPDADPAAFPLNRPVLITDVDTAIGKAGVGGTLGHSLRAIADYSRPFIVVVRVEEGEDAEETDANVIGTTLPSGQKTGMQALLAAEAQLGVKPKILGTPGLETQAVTSALVIVAKRLRGFVYARALGATTAAAIAYRANFSQRELMLLMPDFIAFDVASAANITSDVAARAMGVRAMIDETVGPHKTLSNVTLDGVIGITSDIHWDIEDATSEANLLNAKEITTIIRTDAGFRFWGNRTCAPTDDPFAFESTTRVAQLIGDTMVKGMLWAIDKPLTPALARDIVETINGFGRDLVAAGVLLGFNCWFAEESNSVNSLKAGKLRIDYDYTVPPPLEELGLIQRITDSYFGDFASLMAGAA
ncbi:phage tail sheath subtilisin-like domain-containing protein [Sphingopyxis yananensis]|uniref:phage tail sheath subtilisin-like domain-containing protein n=1 Tax=Sphingopyxis yananensis TaxID=2886687 RepID=UPI001D125B9A|nr:phage tail sheath subtilisin-like domain-containing protein [Sphingopyxis yananensis]MCC2603027.1 phage tail sheath subtilisin-like domain-containing protein [Sphingopyxis yananensis]